MAKLKKNYQTVGHRILNALNNVPIAQNLEFKRLLKLRSEHYFRYSLRDTYDRDDTPAFLINLCVSRLNMDLTDFIPHNKREASSEFLQKVGLKQSPK